MKTVGAYEAKTHFSALLNEVESGETVTVTRHGVAVARIVPVDRDIADAAAALAEWRRYRNEHGIRLGDGVTIRDLIEEGRE